MKSALDRKMDRILARENSGKIKKKIKNRALRKLFANKLSIFGFIIFFLIIFLCVFAPLFTPYSSTKVDLRNILSPPTGAHILGTDKVGRDIWARILYGGRISIEVGLGSALIATILGVSLGTIAGYKGGFFDDVFPADYPGSYFGDDYRTKFVELDFYLLLNRMAFDVSNGAFADVVFKRAGVCTGFKGFWGRQYAYCFCSYASECNRPYFCKHYPFYCHVYFTRSIFKFLGSWSSFGGCYVGKYFKCSTRSNDLEKCMVGMASNRYRSYPFCDWHQLYRRWLKGCDRSDADWIVE